MRTAVDSSVLLDVFLGAEPYVGSSQDALRDCIAKGSLVAGEVVWAEVRAHFRDDHQFREAMDTLGIAYESSSADAAGEAGRVWARYRERGGKREHLIPDFLVAAHALVHAGILLTRDRGFSRRYFPKLKILDPTRSLKNKSLRHATNLGG